MEQIELDFELARRVYTVSQLNAEIRRLLESNFPDLWVAGEISGAKLSSSGHYYFTLKDESSQIRCVCFRNSARLLRFKPEDGIAVLVRGRIDVYEPRGEYQLLVEVLEPQGLGALQLAFEQLKRKLAEEGLFDAARKRPLPRFPTRIGIVTSPAGAVIRDMIQILRRRLPGLHIRLYPAQVQGEGSAAEVIEGVDWFSRSGWPDVVIVARGGGSIEDLWTFNEEEVARAIARCSVPVISAVGHETDVTIADFVADLRAPTPSAAAELVVRTKAEWLDYLGSLRGELEKALRYRLTGLARRLHELGVSRAGASLQKAIHRRTQRVDELEYRLRAAVQRRIEAGWARLRTAQMKLREHDQRVKLGDYRSRLEVASALLAERMRARVASCDARLESLRRELANLNPAAVLERGYAVVRDEGGRIVREADKVRLGSEVDIRLARGALQARVTRAFPGGSSGPPS